MQVSQNLENMENKPAPLRHELRIKIADMTQGATAGCSIAARVISLNMVAEKSSKRSNRIRRVAEVTLGDESGTIKLLAKSCTGSNPLFIDPIELLQPNNIILIEGAFFCTFKGQVHLVTDQRSVISISDENILFDGATIGDDHRSVPFYSVPSD